MRPTFHARALAALLLAALASACCDDCDDCYDCGSDPFFYEHEPNDQACCANYLGSLAPYESVAIRGHITSSGPDYLDGFAFVSAQPIDVRVELVSDDLGDDFDICIYDPLVGGFIACFETPAHPEVGLFSVLEANREFHVVVAPYSGDGYYTLYVEGYPVSLPAPEGAAGAIVDQGEPRSPRPRERALSDYHPAPAVADERPQEPPLELVTVEQDGTVQRLPLRRLRGGTE